MVRLTACTQQIPLGVWRLSLKRRWRAKICIYTYTHVINVTRKLQRICYNRNTEDKAENPFPSRRASASQKHLRIPPSSCLGPFPWSFSNGNRLRSLTARRVVYLDPSSPPTGLLLLSERKDLEKKSPNETFSLFFIFFAHSAVSLPRHLADQREASRFFFRFFFGLLDAESNRGRKASPRSSIPRRSEQLLVDRRAETQTRGLRERLR